MLDMARKLRMERERESKIVHQLQEQRIMVSWHSSFMSSHSSSVCLQIQNLEGKVVEIRQQSSELQRRAADCNAASKSFICIQTKYSRKRRSHMAWV